MTFLSKRIKIEKVEEVTDLHDKISYVIHIRNWKEELDPGLFLESAF